MPFRNSKQNVSNKSLKKGDTFWRSSKNANTGDLDEPVQEYIVLNNIEEHPDSILRSSVNHDPSIAGAASIVKRKNARHDNHQHFKRPSQALPIEWYSFRLNSAMVGFNLELWWRRSVLKTRLNVVFVALLLCIAIMNFSAGIVLIFAHFRLKVDSPYTCVTSDCRKASTWLQQSMNESVDPCENFYEYMCGSHFESDSDLNSVWFESLLHDPAYKIEFGKDGYLAKILKSHQNDDKHDQAITYYKTCLNDRNRRTFKLEAFKDAIKKVFGTVDFNTFESSPAASDMEEIGTQMLRVIGHAVYINMAFYDYPYIQVLLPMWWFGDELDRLDFTDPTNKLVVEQILTKVLGELQVAGNPQLISEMVEGVRVFSEIVDKLLRNFVKYTIVSDAAFEADVKRELDGLCPPMGIHMDVKKIYDKFTQEDSTHLVYHNYPALRYFKGLQICFNEDPSKFRPSVPITQPKTAFVATWVFGIFYELSQYMELTLYDEWGVDKTPIMIFLMDILTSLNIEYQCLTSMWRSLGYLPSIRYLEVQTQDADQFMFARKYLIERLYAETGWRWSQLPNTVDGQTKFFGDKLFDRKLKTDLMMALNGESIDYAHDSMDFTEDHLRNSIAALSYTVERARLSWIGSTSTSGSIKWWGHGDPREIRNELLSLKISMVFGARFLPEVGAAKADKWDTFLGRKPSNYILFPLTLYNEPHSTETLALEHASTTVKIMRSFFAVFREAAFDYSYGKYEVGQLEEILDWDYQANPQSSHQCKFIDPENLTNPYGLVDTLSSDFTDMFTVITSEQFYSNLAVKIAFSHFRQDIAGVDGLRFDWSLHPFLRNYKMNRILPGKIAKYSEEQLFFMSFVRHICRKSWKDAPNAIDRRYNLEASILNVLMGMEEFSQVWKCKNTSFMNLQGNRCLRGTISI